MRTNEERISMVHKRTTELKLKKEKKKRRVLDAVSMAVCLLLVVGIGAFMPAIMSGVTQNGAVHSSGAASLIADHTALGYILMGLLAFLLGMSVTVLMYRLRSGNERRYKGDSTDEL